MNSDNLAGLPRWMAMLERTVADSANDKNKEEAEQWLTRARKQMKDLRAITDEGKMSDAVYAAFLLGNYLSNALWVINHGPHEMERLQILRDKTAERAKAMEYIRRRDEMLRKGEAPSMNAAYRKFAGEELGSDLETDELTTKAESIGRLCRRYQGKKKK